jgi:hypothetical protein
VKLFQILTEEALAELTREQAEEYRDALRATAEKIHAKDPETVGELPPDELLAEMRAGVSAIKLANDHIAALDAAAEPEDEMAALAAEAMSTEAPEPDAEPAPEEDDPPAEEEEPAEEPAEPAEGEGGEESPDAASELTQAALALAEAAKALNASAPREVVDTASSTLPKPRPERQPVEAKQSVALTAAAEGLGLAIGAPFEDEVALAAAMIHKRRNFGHMTAREDVPVARLDWSDLYPEDRMLSPLDGVERTKAKTDAILASIVKDPNRLTDKGLIASGGICAPVTPYYDLMVISQADRPVRASLPSFLASRGGIQFATPPTMADVGTAIGIITAAEDGAGGSAATKTCQVLECPDWNEVDVSIIYHCIQTSNLTNRTFPEQLAQFNQLVMAALARLAESTLLDGIDGQSTQVTAADIGLGASGALLTEILVAAEGMRSRHRMTPGATLRVMLPEWAASLMVSDVIRSQFQRFDTDTARITALLRSFNVEPTFYLDGSTGDSQIFGAQSAGALLPYPSTVKWFMFPEGSFLYLDGGTLELGLVRDSVLNSTNEFQIFGEFFENVAFIGVESLAVTSTVCDNGVVSLPDTITCGDYSNGG